MRSSLLYLFLFVTTVRAYNIVQDYSGQNFFDGWDFFGNYDNLTLGDVWWLSEVDAFSEGLAYVNAAGNAIIKVDNTSNVAYGQKRNSVRITTQESYGVGSLWVIDLKHIPYGCSVWPAFWTLGSGTWPAGGEIDIIEGINVMTANQMALHTEPGCTQATPAYQSGILPTGPGAQDCSQASGCLVTESAPNSYQSGFAAAGGGVWAVQFDVAGVYMWFWSRPNVPASLTGATSTSALDISQWGVPSASYASTTCNIPQFFTAQQLVLDITLCGNWASLPVFYSATCGSSGPTGICYNDNVVGAGSPKYDEAYFEISYIRAYTTFAPAATPSAAAAAQVVNGTTINAAPTAAATSGGVAPNTSNQQRGAGVQLQVGWCGVLVGVLAGGLVVFS
ncbi:glycoside hydrolase family 16 protein [Plicaturopsis crispa FD-325 SS-3]|nr:glycoside hydrolase family 16 protein [Plicaturopsis crispa FD-325 SS-3]